MKSDKSNPEHLYTVHQAAEYLAVSPALVYRLVVAREIEHIRIGIGRGLIRFTRAHLEEYKRSRKM